MAYEYNELQEYFLGIILPRKENKFFVELKKQLHPAGHISSPPHLTIKPPFQYHFEKPLLEQLEKWAKKQTAFTVHLEKVGSFKHQHYGTIFLSPETAKDIKKMEQDLSRSIRFLPAQNNFIPHFTVGNRIPLEMMSEVKKQVRAMVLSLELKIDHIALLRHERRQPWEIYKVFKFKK